MELIQRPRRLRGSDAVRRLCRETRLSPDSLIYPIFVDETLKGRRPIPALEGQYHYGLDTVCEAVQECLDAGVGRCILFLAARDMAAINAHTNLDCAPGGVNDCLAGALGLEETVVLNPSGTDGQGRPWGLLRAGRREPVSLEAFLEQVKQRLGCPGLRYVSGGRPVCRVAVGGGACGDEIDAVIAAGCDTFVTSDLTYHQFLDAAPKGINLIDAGHFPTEDPVCAKIVAYLEKEFPQLIIIKSTSHKEVIQYFVEGE